MLDHVYMRSLFHTADGRRRLPNGKRPIWAGRQRCAAHGPSTRGRFWVIERSINNIYPICDAVSLYCIICMLHQRMHVAPHPHEINRNDIRFCTIGRRRGCCRHLPLLRRFAGQRIFGISSLLFQLEIYISPMDVTRIRDATLLRFFFFSCSVGQCNQESGTTDESKRGSEAQWMLDHSRW